MWSTKTLEWIDIELTSFCNLHCPSCFRETDQAKQSTFLNSKVLDLQLIKKRLILNDLPNIKIINFCGSIDEPTTHPQLFDIIKYFKTWNVHINIATNGSTRTPAFWQNLGELLKDSPHRIHFGIDGSNELSERYRKGSSFPKVQQNWRAFISGGGKAIWQFIVFDWNEHQLNEARQLSNEEGFVGFKTIYSHRNKSGEKQTQHIEEKCIDCRYLKQQRIFINHMGDVIPCCHLNSETIVFNNVNKPFSDYTNLYYNSFGKLSSNLKYQSLSEILNGSLFNNITKSWTSPLPLEKCINTCKAKKHDIFIKETF